MEPNTAAARAWDRATPDRLAALLSLAALVALTLWAQNAGAPADLAEHPRSPSVVEAVEGSEFSRVTLTAQGAQRIGLRLARVRPAPGAATRLAVPYGAVVYGADGATWVYAIDGDPLRFRRQVVEVETVADGKAILSRGPAVGTEIAGVGSAELYGTEFEVGH